MTGRRACVWMGAAAMLAATACDDLRAQPQDCGDGEITERSLQSNGFRINGFRINGFRINGFRINGTTLTDDDSADWIKLVGIDLKGGEEAQTAWLEGSKLVVQTTGGELRSGAQLDSLRMYFDIDGDGKGKHDKTLKFLDIEQVPGTDIWMVDASIKEKDGAWLPLCTDANGEPTQAILLGQVWNPTTGARVSPTPTGAITFACRDAALAKCVEWGYRPWADANGVSLLEYHQACTRLVRADYCGDGTPHTQDGTGIHVLDQVGVQGLDPNVNFVVEAEWGPSGAVCLNAENMRLGAQALNCSVPACGAGFSSGGLIQSGKIVP